MTAPVHIYRAREQPSHRFVVEFGDGHRHWIRRPGRSLVRCVACRKLRWAQNCVVQVYYDSVRDFCRPGKGCKS